MLKKKILSVVTTLALALSAMSLTASAYDVNNIGTMEDLQAAIDDGQTQLTITESFDFNGTITLDDGQSYKINVASGSTLKFISFVVENGTSLTLSGAFTPNVGLDPFVKADGWSEKCTVTFDGASVTEATDLINASDTDIIINNSTLKAVNSSGSDAPIQTNGSGELVVENSSVSLDNIGCLFCIYTDATITGSTITAQEICFELVYGTTEISNTQFKLNENGGHAMELTDGTLILGDGITITGNCIGLYNINCNIKLQ